MPTTFEILEKAPESLIAAGVRSAFIPRNRAVIAADCRHGSVTTVLEPAPEPAMDACCLWCNRTFTPRMTGGSTQKFCCTGHRQQFWIAARRWDDAGDRGGPTLGRLPKGVSYERARCLKGIPRPGIPRWLSAFGRAGPDAKSRRIWTTANKIRTKEGSACPVVSVKQFETQAPRSFPALIREIESGVLPC